METIDWSSFTKRISIRVTQEKIFKHFIFQELLEKWFLSSAEFYNFAGEIRSRDSIIQSGDTYRWRWYGSDNLAEGKIIENKEGYLKFTFLDCMVEVGIKREEDENILVLTQSEIPLDEQARLNYYVGCTRGCNFYMTNLKSILEGGKDLRNRNSDLSNVINT